MTVILSIVSQELLVSGVWAIAVQLPQNLAGGDCKTSTIRSRVGNVYLFSVPVREYDERGMA